MTIDVHHHYAPPAVVEYLRTTATERSPLGELASSYLPRLPQLTAVDARLAEMDACGIELAVLSVSPMGLERPELPRHRAIDIVRRGNDELLELATNRPDRFAAMISLPFPDADACRAELRRIAGDPAARAVIAPALTVPPALDEAPYAPLLADIAAAGLPVLIHPAFEPAPELFDPYRLDTAIAAVAQTSAVAARLALSGTLDRLPELALIVPHLGGTLPYLLGRLIDQSSRGAAERDLGYYLRNRLWLDSCSFHGPALRCAVDSAGADRIVFGSDYPFRGGLERAVGDLAGSDLSGPDRAAILRENAVADLWISPRD